MTHQVTISLVKELRTKTGVGMSKCKAALEEANGDLELAIANLRKAGFASAAKREERETKEGMIGYSENDTHLALVEVNAETDFVVKNETFKEFVNNIAQETVNTNPQSLESFINQKYSKDPTLTIDQYRSLIIQKIGENIQIKRINIIEKDENVSLGIYSHMGGKIVAAVKLEGSNNEQSFAKDIAMHIAAEKPQYIDIASIPEDIKNEKKNAFKEEVKTKPANIIDKIVEGKMRAFYDKVCLYNQEFIKDSEITIAQLLGKHSKDIQKPLKVKSFICWAIEEEQFR